MGKGATEDWLSGARPELALEIRALEHKLLALKEELAAQEESVAQSGVIVDVLRFAVGQQQFALRLSEVVEVLRMVKLHPLPRAPEGIEGVINCRGSMLPVLSLSAIVSIDRYQPTISSSLVVVETSVQRLALIVERVDGVASIDRAAITDTQPQQELQRTLPRYVAGYIRHDQSVLTLLSVQDVLSTEEHKHLSVALRERDEWGRA